MKQFISFIFVGTLILLGVLVSRNVSGTPTPTTSPTASPVAQGGGAPTGTLFATQFSAKGTTLQKIDVSTKERTAIFSDQGKTSRIQKLSTASRDGQTILAVMGDGNQTTGSLVSIALDGSGTQAVLVSNFPFVNDLILSSDNATIGYASQSNDSAQPGVLFTTMSVTGSNKKTLFTEPTMIQSPIFSPDSQSIAYIRGNTTSHYQIVSRNLTTKKETVLYQSVERITQFDWSAIGLMVVGTGDETSSKLLIFDPRTSTTQHVEAEGVIPGSATIAPDASGIAYQTATDSIVINLGDQSKTSYSAVTKLLGWTR